MIHSLSQIEPSIQMKGVDEAGSRWGRGQAPRCPVIARGCPVSHDLGDPGRSGTPVGDRPLQSLLQRYSTTGS
jgi:hypothetical protein